MLIYYCSYLSLATNSENTLGIAWPGHSRLYFSTMDWFVSKEDGSFVILYFQWTEQTFALNPFVTLHLTYGTSVSSLHCIIINYNELVVGRLGSVSLLYLILAVLMHKFLIIGCIDVAALTYITVFCCLLKCKMFSDCCSTSSCVWFPASLHVIHIK